MTRGKDNVAESLGDLLEPLRSRRSSGLLSVERLESGHFEEGEIYFHLGQPTYARVGNLVGQEAFTRLLGWRRFYFSFSANASPSHRLHTGATPVPSSGEVPVVPDTHPLPPPSGQFQAANNAHREQPPDTDALVPLQPATISQANRRVLGMSDLELLRSSLRDGLDIPGIELLIPHRSGSDKNVLSLPLTRPQRSLYLLIDGRRTISDLARCMRKGIQEIERLLSELQEKDLITF